MAQLRVGDRRGQQTDVAARPARKRQELADPFAQQEDRGGEHGEREDHRRHLPDDAKQQQVEVVQPVARERRRERRGNEQHRHDREEPGPLGQLGGAHGPRHGVEHHERTEAHGQTPQHPTHLAAVHGRRGTDVGLGQDADRQQHGDTHPQVARPVHPGLDRRPGVLPAVGPAQEGGRDPQRDADQDQGYSVSAAEHQAAPRHRPSGQGHAEVQQQGRPERARHIAPPANGPVQRVGPAGRAERQVDVDAAREARVDDAAPDPRPANRDERSREQERQADDDEVDVGFGPRRPLGLDQEHVVDARTADPQLDGLPGPGVPAELGGVEHVDDAAAVDLPEDVAGLEPRAFGRTARGNLQGDRP